MHTLMLIIDAETLDVCTIIFSSVMSLFWLGYLLSTAKKIKQDKR